MRKIQTAIWFLCSLLIGISLGTIAVRTYESYSFKPWEWNEPPIILNCYKEDLNSLYIIEAVPYWSTKGHSFSYIENNPSDALCQAEYIQGFIMIKKADLPYNTLGETSRRIFMGKIVAAVIYFDSGTYKITNVFEHEMGHAIGYNHVEIEDHIMHPIWEKMTPKFWIPE